MKHQISSAYHQVGHPTFLVGQDADGYWIARDRTGLIGGIFVSRKAAIDFVEFEVNHDPDAVILLSDSQYLTLAGSLPPEIS